MSRLLLRLSYDGTDLHGCPEHPEARTVCGVLRQAFERVNAPPLALETLSRTDAGVHARGNVGHVLLPRATTPAQVLGWLDRHLPRDLRCTAAAHISTLPPCGPKIYTYQLDRSPWGDPHLSRTAWRPPAALDPALLDELSASLTGRHDFAAFRRHGEHRTDLRRTILRSTWTHETHQSLYTIRAERFFYRMIRALVGGMVATASGACSVEAWHEALRGTPTHASRQTAPAGGLCLEALSIDADWVS